MVLPSRQQQLCALRHFGNRLDRCNALLLPIRHQASHLRLVAPVTAPFPAPELVKGAGFEASRTGRDFFRGLECYVEVKPPDCVLSSVFEDIRSSGAPWMGECVSPLLYFSY